MPGPGLLLVINFVLFDLSLSNFREFTFGIWLTEYFPFGLICIVIVESDLFSDFSSFSSSKVFFFDSELSYFPLKETFGASEPKGFKTLYFAGPGTFLSKSLVVSKNTFPYFSLPFAKEYFGPWGFFWSKSVPNL